MSRRIAVVGTDTGVGKTAVVCALLHHARATGRRVLPFKPAASAVPGDPGDPARLVLAAGMPPDAAPRICPLRYEQPLAPGIAHDPTPFHAGGPAVLGPPFHAAAQALEDLERTHQPELVLVEGAGGLHVPMPDGGWLPQWLAVLAPDVLVVGRLGLGTINHTRLTLEALPHHGLRSLGFVLVQTTSAPDPSARDNAAVLTISTGVPHLATVPYDLDPDRRTDWIDDALWRALA